MLASHTIVMANGNGGNPARRARSTTSGVSRTAVVSSEKKTVQDTARSTVTSHSARTRPRARRAEAEITRSKTPA